MKKLLSILLVLAMLMGLAACGGGSGEKEPEKVYTDYTELYTSEFTTLDYTNTTLSINNTFTRLTIDTLVDFDEYGLLRPGLADSWKISDDSLTYTFYLHPGLMWYDYQGNAVEEITANDWVTAAKHMLNPNEVTAGTGSQIYKTIAGAKEYYDDNSIGFDKVGIKAIDDYTLEYTLKNKCAYFLSMTSKNAWTPIPTKWFEEHRAEFGNTADSILYCGAYYCTNWEAEYERTLVANPAYRYYDQVSIASLTYRYNKEATSNGAELFLRGDTSKVTLNNDVYREWLKDEAKASQVHKGSYGYIPYFMIFNFDPQFDAEYEPENWKLAVNNVNFRKSIFYGINKYAYNATLDEWNYEEKTMNTIMFKDFISIDGVDYTLCDGLDEYTNAGDTYDEAKALAYKEKAIEELTAKGCHFPVKVLMVYATSATTSTRYQVFKSQIEKLFGPDYIQIEMIPYSGNSINSEIRNTGKWALFETNWGPDYVDPCDCYYFQMKSGCSTTKGMLWAAEEYYDESVGYGDFDKLAEEAASIYDDMNLRYHKFAQAEKLLLDEALCIPLYRSGGGFVADLQVPFTGATTMYGIYSRTLRFGELGEKSCDQDTYDAIKTEFFSGYDAARAAYVEESKAYYK